MTNIGKLVFVVVHFHILHEKDIIEQIFFQLKKVQTFRLILNINVLLVRF